MEELVLFTSRLESSPDLDSSGLGSRHPWTRGLEPSSYLDSTRLEPARADSSGIERTRVLSCQDASTCYLFPLKQPSKN